MPCLFDYTIQTIYIYIYTDYTYTYIYTYIQTIYILYTYYTDLMTKLVYIMAITRELLILSFQSVFQVNYKFTGVMFFKIK